MHEEKFTEIYGNPRGGAAREPCVDFVAAKNTVGKFTQPQTNNVIAKIETL
jgi:hypothetical protein